jgi:2-oxoglutarate ferredoxin oxidoreductase subunit gamma
MENSYVIAGFGGQGVLLAGEILANAFMCDDKYVTWYPSYGAEMRGGTVNCEIVACDEPVSAVNKKEIDFLVVLNQNSFDKFLPKVKKGGMVVANSSLIEEKKERDDIKYVFVPMTTLAQKTGNIKNTNVLSLGVLAKESNVVSFATLSGAIEKVLSKKPDLLPMNFEALNLGYTYDIYSSKIT